MDYGSRAEVKFDQIRLQTSGKLCLMETLKGSHPVSSGGVA